MEQVDPYAFLEKHSIRFVQHDHKAVFTVEESNELYDHIPGSHTKNLFLANKDESRFFLYIIASHKRADLKHIAEVVGEKKLFFGSPERLMEVLGVTPGSVSALGVINDTHHVVEVLVDTEVWESDEINGHPNTNTATLTFPRNDFHRIFEASEHEVTVV